MRLALAGILMVPALILTTQLYAAYRAGGVPISFVGMFAIQLCNWEVWVLLGPLVWSIEKRWPVDTPRRTTIIRHALTAPVVATVSLSAYLLLYHLLVRVPFLASWFTGLDRGIRETIVFFFATNFHVEVLVYLAIVVAAHASRTTSLLRAKEHDTLRLEAELVQARLTTLRTQLQPHFLFNTLHTIGSLVLQRKNEQAVQLLAELGELLRASLAHRDTDLAPLREELAYLRRYLRIEEARFGDRLRVDWAIDPAVEEALIPPFILQPIVENAFRHGISKRIESSVLTITAAHDGSKLHLTVHNDGPPLAAAFDAQHFGYGLKNVSERLSTRKPPGHLELINADGGVKATLVLPLVRAGEGAPS